MKAELARSLSVSTILILLSCKGPVERLHKINADSYSPTELWDAMLGSEEQSGHALSPSGPPPLSYVRIKGVVSRIEFPPPDNVAESPK